MSRFLNATITIVVAGIVLASPLCSQSSPNSPQKELRVTKHAHGTFEIKMTPQPSDLGDPTLGRFTAEKQLHGDLEGTSKGEMLSAGNPATSGAYVAIEKVTGSLQGRSGTFVLQHSGTMTRGTSQLTITVVPDSGTGELTGIAGTFIITNDKGKHSYEFDYTLPERP